MSNMTQAWRQWEGTVLNGEFHLRRYLGGSEHSAVFLTVDREQGLEKAAIKLVPADSVNADLQLSRWNEAARLSHPHLIRLFHTGRCQLGDRDMLYVVMEYADLDMSQVLRGVPLPPEETRTTFKLILDVLSYLHGEGFIHGHLKPANIMGVDNQLKLSSDGLCRIGEPSGDREMPGTYDPPEAANGTNSPAMDVWSLGITLVEALTQHQPAHGGTEEEELLPPRTLPAPFFNIARNCFLRDPERRWTVAEIAAQLEQAAPVPKPKKEFTKRRYIVPVAAAALALVVLAGLKLMDHHRSEPATVQNPVTSSTEPPTPKPAEKQQSAPPVRPSRPSLQAGAAAKAPTGGGVVQVGVQKKVLPNASQNALDTIQGTIRVIVKVAVNPSGNVVDATLDYPGPSKYFARLSVEAARQWKFQPAEVDGRPVSQELLLQFDFEKTGMQASPVQSAP